MFSKNKNMMKGIIKQIALQEGISTTEVRREMEMAIEDAHSNTDPGARINFKRLFGNKIPTPEEFIEKISKQVS